MRLVLVMLIIVQVTTVWGWAEEKSREGRAKKEVGECGRAGRRPLLGPGGLGTGQEPGATTQAWRTNDQRTRQAKPKQGRRGIGWS